MKYALFFIMLSLAWEIPAVERGKDDCDPLVMPELHANTLQQVLTALAKQHDFELNFPVNADQPVELVEGMHLSQALKYLTSGVNTVLQYEKVDGCAKARLVSMEVLPVGEEGEYIHVKPVSDSSPQVQAEARSEPVYIDNMEQYAEDVLLKKRQRERNLSSEQKQEFRQVKKQVRMRLEAEGLLEPRRNKNKRNKRGRRRFYDQEQ
ncbi:MAG: hypothetical protein OQK32_02190, partial [Gammaproteobacteria bacterium]|nr:hypothetical protein [Gammaproteobacteria bacterium]